MTDRLPLLLCDHDTVPPHLLIEFVLLAAKVGLVHRFGSQPRAADVLWWLTKHDGVVAVNADGEIVGLAVRDPMGMTTIPALGWVADSLRLAPPGDTACALALGAITFDEEDAPVRAAA